MSAEGQQELERLRQKLENAAKGTFWEYTGCQVETFTDKEICTFLDVQPHHLNGIGILNGGMHATLLDNTMGLAAMAAFPKHKVVTVQLHVHYLSPVMQEQVRVKAEVLHQSRSMITTQGRLTGKDGRLCAFGTATYRALQP